jgi:uncharacterized membrane protein YdjX (TVP38/TMEM64 family)
VLCVILVFGCIFLVVAGSLDHLAQWCIEMSKSGHGGTAHAVFALLFVGTSMPFGWGLTPLLIASGAAFGWSALLTAECSVIGGSIFSFWLTRSWGQQWVRNKIGNMSEQRRNKVEAVEQMIQEPRWFLMLVSLRNTPLLTLGMVNGFLSVLDISLPLFAASTTIGVQTDVFTMISIGSTLRSITAKSGDVQEGHDSVSSRLLILQVCVSVGIALGGMVLSRRIDKHLDEKAKSRKPAAPKSLPNEMDNAELGV